MDRGDKHMDNNIERDPLSRLGKGKILWEVSSEDAWVEMQSKIDETATSRTITHSRSFVVLAAAAVIALLIGIPSLMRFYTITLSSESGEHLDLTLPDGSSVSMNAETTIKYHPMWWRFNRAVQLAGEAYFEVVKGDDFVVVSDIASTSVLGTSFNILSRDSDYEVTCITGKVKVFTPGNRSEVFLTSNQKAILSPDGILDTEENIISRNSITWKNGEFFFTSVPLEMVFEEIERQFGITIDTKVQPGLVYTGNFSRNHDVDMILDLVCKPFGIKFETTETETYLIIKDEQDQ